MLACGCSCSRAQRGRRSLCCPAVDSFRFCWGVQREELSQQEPAGLCGEGLRLWVSEGAADADSQLVSPKGGGGVQCVMYLGCGGGMRV